MSMNCAYTKTTTSVTLVQNFSRALIVADKERINSLEQSLRSHYGVHNVLLSLVQNGIYQFGDIDF